MQTSKKNGTIKNSNVSRLEKTAEILALMEESQKTKEWIFQEIKRKHLKISAKRSMNSLQVLNLCPIEFVTGLLHTLKAKDIEDIGDINSFTKTYHWFFTDIVAGSNPTIPSKEQARKVVVLNELIDRTETFKKRDPKSTVILPTGDGMAIGFMDSPEYPLRLAIQTHKLLTEYNKTRRSKKEKVLLRIGIDIGPVYVIKDLNQQDNVWGPGIIITRRVMDLAGDMNIFCSERFAQDVRALSPEYKEIIHDIGNFPIKHGEQLHIFNIYGEGFGTKQFPHKGKIIEKTETFDEELKKKTKFVFNQIDIKLDVQDIKTMLTHHEWLWNLINESDKPRDDVFYYLEGDTPKDIADLNIRATDEEENELSIGDLSENKPTSKKFTIKLKKPIKPKQRKRFIKLEYDWEEPERMFFYKVPTDCKKFSYKFSIPKGIDLKPRILEVDTELGYTWVAKPSPSINYRKEGTEITWEKTNLKKGDAYQFLW